MIAQSHLNVTETQYESLFAAIRCTLQIRMILKKMFIECNNGYNSFVFMMKKYNMNIYNRNLFHLTCDQFLYLKHKENICAGKERRTKTEVNFCACAV